MSKGGSAIAPGGDAPSGRQLPTPAYAFLPILPAEASLRRRSKSGRGRGMGERVSRIYVPRPCPGGHGEVRSAPATEEAASSRRGPRRLTLHYQGGEICPFSHVVIPGQGPGSAESWEALLAIHGPTAATTPEAVVR